MTETPPEPGTIPDLNHGLPGDPDPLPSQEPDETTMINDEEEEEDA